MAQISCQTDQQMNGVREITNKPKDGFQEMLTGYEKKQTG